MTPKDALSAAVDAQIARVAGPQNAEKPDQHTRPLLEGITAEITSNLMRIAEDRAAQSRAEAERQAALKAAREYQAAERGRQLLREHEARQAARAKPTAQASPPAAIVPAWPSTSPPAPNAAESFDQRHARQRRQGCAAIFTAARGRAPTDAELESMVLHGPFHIDPSKIVVADPRNAPLLLTRYL